jgi:cell wall-associated NlpC family hydrolase
MTVITWIRNLSLIVICSIVVTGCEEKKPTTGCPPISDARFNNIIVHARSFIGTPYRWGGTTRRGIDCSAYMQHCFADPGYYYLPRTSEMQAMQGTPIAIQNVRPCDLLFFREEDARPGENSIHHVGMVLDVCNEGIYFIHASGGNIRSVQETLLQGEWQQRFIMARRILPN